MTYNIIITIFLALAHKHNTMVRLNFVLKCSKTAIRTVTKDYWPIQDEFYFYGTIRTATGKRF